MRNTRVRVGFRNYEHSFSEVYLQNVTGGIEPMLVLCSLTSRFMYFELIHSLKGHELRA